MSTPAIPQKVDFVSIACSDHRAEPSRPCVNGGLLRIRHSVHALAFALACVLPVVSEAEAAPEAGKAAKPAPAKVKSDKGPAAALPPLAKEKKAPADAEPEEAPEVKAAKGVVVLQRAGIPLGLGAVLASDGRIVTALSSLGSGNDLEAKFSDGSVSKLKVGHHDRTWDLALLIPQSGKWPHGLAASSVDPIRDDADIHAFQTNLRSNPAPIAVELPARRSLLGGDDKTLISALELGTRINPLNLGSPLVDESGRVVGLITRGCLPVETNKPCIPVAFGVPVPMIKSFLKAAPAEAVAPAPWLGIQGVKDENKVVKGVRLVSVAKGSPASKSKLKGGGKSQADMIVAVAGEPVTTPEELAQAIRAHAVGEKIPLTLFSQGVYRQVEVQLGIAPDTAKNNEDAPTAPAVTPGPAKVRPGAGARKGAVNALPTSSPATDAFAQAL